jgi:hypothetical protein
MTIKKIGTLIVVLILYMAVSAQSRHKTAVAQAVEKLRLAMIDGNGHDLEKIVSDKLSYGHSSGVIDNKKEFVEKLVSGKSDFVSIELSEQTVTISQKTAVVRHILNAKTNDNGKPGEVHLRALLIWQKQHGNWILLARQAVKIS